MSPYRIIAASELAAGPATIVVHMPDQTVRSRVVMAVAEPHGVVRVAFASGALLTLDRRSRVGVIEPRAARRSGR